MIFHFSLAQYNGHRYSKGEKKWLIVGGCVYIYDTEISKVVGTHQPHGLQMIKKEVLAFFQDILEEKASSTRIIFEAKNNRRGRMPANMCV